MQLPYELAYYKLFFHKKQTYKARKIITIEATITKSKTNIR